MIRAGCGTIEANPPQQSIKRREKCGRVVRLRPWLVALSIRSPLNNIHLSNELAPTRIAVHHSRFRIVKTIGALDEIDHVSGRMNRERMLGKAGP